MPQVQNQPPKMTRQTRKGQTPAPASPPAAEPAATDRGGPSKWRQVFIAAGLAVITLVLFWRVQEFDFVLFDDMEYAAEHPVVRQGVTWEGIRWAFTHAHLGNWHPLTTLS